MDLLDISLIFSITLCSLVSGFIFTYAIVVMPGLSKLNDKEFIRAFQVTDSVIQNDQPICIFIWIGSVISIICKIIISIMTLVIIGSTLIILISILYLLRVRGITVSIHFPLNKHIKKLMLIQWIFKYWIMNEKIFK